MKKRVRYTDHARDRMRERNVTESEVEEVLRKADITYPGKRGKTNYQGTVKDRRIRVTVKETSKDQIVVTVVPPDE